MSKDIKKLDIKANDYQLPTSFNFTTVGAVSMFGHPRLPLQQEMAVEAVKSTSMDILEYLRRGGYNIQMLTDESFEEIAKTDPVLQEKVARFKAQIVSIRKDW